MSDVLGWDPENTRVLVCVHVWKELFEVDAEVKELKVISAKLILFYFFAWIMAKEWWHLTGHLSE